MIQEEVFNETKNVASSDNEPKTVASSVNEHANCYGNYNEDDSNVATMCAVNVANVPDKEISPSSTQLDQKLFTDLVLHPDDALMKRFQDTLRAHLIRTEKKLSEEINEIKLSLRALNKEREKEGLKIHTVKVETDDQRKAIKKYQSMLSDVTNVREQCQEEIKNAKESHKKTYEELNADKLKQSKMMEEIQRLNFRQKQYNEWSTEISNEIILSKRKSEKEAALEREMIRENSRKDYILYKLTEEIWKLEAERDRSHEQLVLKENENISRKQEITDVNEELNAVQKEQKLLLNQWNEVFTHIRKQDEVNDELEVTCRDMKQSTITVRSQIERTKEVTMEEMKNNERLTYLQMKMEREMKSMIQGYKMDREKEASLQAELATSIKITERSQAEHDIALSALQSVQKEENLLRKDLEKLSKYKYDLEEKLLKRLNETVTHDKTVKFLSKTLRDVQNQCKKEELSMTQTENTYAKNILQIEKHTSFVVNKKYDLDDISQNNKKKEKDIEQIRVEIKRCESSINAKQGIITNLNKKIDEVTRLLGEDEMNLQNVKMNTLERNIEEIEAKNKKSQRIWQRQEGDLITLSEQRNFQLEELGSLTKQIMIMEQKNYKMEYELEKQTKEENNINRQINELQQMLSQKNSRLAMRREFKGHLQDKYFVTRNDYMALFEDAEKEIIQLQTEIKELEREKILLKEQFNSVHREAFSWEEKVQLAYETSKSFKDERKADGDIAMMKREIHKMEMRLSHLKKAQVKLIQDMELSITKRENIMEKATAYERRNPKSQHNRKIIFRKYLEEQKHKIKQLVKETSQLEDTILTMEKDQKDLLEKLDDIQKILREMEDVIPDIDKRITELEIIKHNNLEILIRKQRKVSMFHNIKNGRYKISHKSESSLNNELFRQQMINVHLKEIMKESKKDFPILKNEIRKIVLSLEL